MEIGPEVEGLDTKVLKRLLAGPTLQPSASAAPTTEGPSSTSPLEADNQGARRTRMRGGYGRKGPAFARPRHPGVGCCSGAGPT